MLLDDYRQILGILERTRLYDFRIALQYGRHLEMSIIGMDEPLDFNTNDDSQWLIA